MRVKARATEQGYVCLWAGGGGKGVHWEMTDPQTSLEGKQRETNPETPVLPWLCLDCSQQSRPQMKWGSWEEFGVPLILCSTNV